MLKAVIFDFNGVLVDDELIHLELFNEVLTEYDIRIEKRQYLDRYLACSDIDFFRQVLTEGGAKIRRGTIDKLIKQKNKRYLEVVADRPLLFPGAMDLVETFAETYPVGIVSGALGKEIETVLEHEQIRQYFSFLVSAEDVLRGKPDPEGFVIALNKINDILDLSQFPANPSECLVIEDSPGGIDSARSLGMRCLGIAHTVPRAELVEADLVYDSLLEIRLDRVRDLFQS